MELKCMLVTVTDMERARKFYEDIFGLELLQDCFCSRELSKTCSC